MKNLLMLIELISIFQPAIPFKSGYYFPNQNNAVLNIKVTNTSEPYLFVVIEAHFGITGSVGMCVFACVNNWKGPGIILIEGLYYTSIIENDDIEQFSLEIYMKNTIVEVEIGRTDDNVQFAIESERKNSTLKNETKLIQKESIVNGISRFILKPNVTTNGGISISFFRTPTTGKVINNYSKFLIKYQVENAEEKLPSFKYDREIKVELKEKEIIIIADNIVKNSETYWVRYYLRIYNKTDNFVLSKIDNLFEEANPSVTPLVDKQIDLIKTNDNMTYIEQLSSLSEEFYITISSNFR